MKSYFQHYGRSRTPLSLAKDAPKAEPQRQPCYALTACPASIVSQSSAVDSKAVRQPAIPHWLTFFLAERQIYTMKKAPNGSFCTPK